MAKALVGVERRTNELFDAGNCQLCNRYVRGVANRNRHLDSHVRAGHLKENGDRGFRWIIVKRPLDHCQTAPGSLSNGPQRGAGSATMSGRCCEHGYEAGCTICTPARVVEGPTLDIDAELGLLIEDAKRWGRTSSERTQAAAHRAMSDEPRYPQDVTSPAPTQQLGEVAPRIRRADAEQAYARHEIGGKELEHHVLAQMAATDALFTRLATAEARVRELTDAMQKATDADIEFAVRVLRERARHARGAMMGPWADGLSRVVDWILALHRAAPETPERTET